MSQQRPIDSLFSRRAMIAAGAGGAMFAGLIARLFQLQVLEGERFDVLAAENSVRLDLAPPPRGRIMDRFGRALATHRQAGRVSIIPEQVSNTADTVAAIARLIQVSETRAARILSEARRVAGFQEVIVASELSYEDFAKMSVRAPDLPGVKVTMAATRSYPRGRDFAHVLGYVAKASESDLNRLSEGANPQERAAIRRLFKHPDMRTGRSGVERYAEDWLRGQAGFRKLEANAAGRIIREFDDPALAPKPGRDLYLTVDAELQRAAIERFGGESGAAVVMDIETGDILAFVSTPAFDPNDFVNGISQADYDLLRFNNRSPLYHKAYDGTYPPGSTFKMVVATAALEAGVIDPNERISCPGHYRFGRNTWHCWKRGGHGPMNMHDAIKQSCDVYFYEVARRMGIEHLAEVSKRFGFGQRWELGLLGGRPGVVPNDEWKRAARGEPWFEGETLNIGIGQGQVSTSPLQLALMTARIAAEGKIITPRIIGEGPTPEADIPLDAPLDPGHMQRMKAAMFGVTSEAGGTALRSGDLGLGGPRLSGKTGTAQVRRITAAERASGNIRGGDDIARELRDHALFVGYAPHDAPKYAVSVIVEHGEGGSKTAAPIARDILSMALRLESRRTPVYSTLAAAAGVSLGNANQGEAP
ncbi:MAG: penicillin-binding protein 2 [Pseudomonadota bacterium]